MKKLAVSSLALALGLGGAARAQSPFFQPPAQPILPVSASAPMAPPLPPGGVIPVRVHFGGALTKDGVVPLPVYTNQPIVNLPAGSAPVQPVQIGWTPGGTNVRPVAGQAASSDAKKETKSNVIVLSEDNYAPPVSDPRFVAPDVGDMYRPRPAPPGYRWYTSAEYLHYLWVRNQESPELLFVGDIPVTAADVDARDRQGARFTIGHWLDTCRPWALEGSIMFTGQRRSRSTYNSNGVVPLDHPFIDAAVGLPDSLSVAADAPALDPRSGSSELEVGSRMFGFEVNLRRELCRTSHGHLDLLIGYRQFHLDESIAIRDRVVYDTGPTLLSDATVTSFDEFGTHNRLFAGQVGIEGELNWRRFFIDAWGKFALGSNEEVINISGATHMRATPGRLPPAGALNGANFAGALFAQPSNIGRYDDNQFTVMPEVGVNVGFKITSNVRLSAGYTFLYLNNIVRPGDAIDTTICRNQIPQLQPAQSAGTRPAPPTFIESSYWAHGLIAQVEFRY